MIRIAGRVASLLMILLWNHSHAQDAKPIHLTLPTQPNWNVVSEGNTVRFDLKATGPATDTLYFSLGDGRPEGMDLDSLGHFS